MGQIGYSRVRAIPGQPAPGVITRVYAEVRAGPLQSQYRREWFDAPLPDMNTYRCFLSAPTLGRWEFDYDNAPLTTITLADWSNDTGNRVDVTTEVFNTEDRMVGTPSNRCRFTQCMRAINNGEFEPVTLTDTNMHNGLSSRYGLQRTGPDSFEVWDLRP